MKIIRLSASNFMRLVAVEIKPEGNVITIAGKNCAGKSSVLNAIVAALGGKNVAPKKPIRDGQQKAIVVVETEELTIARKFTSSGSYLEVTNKDGFAAKSPQAVLDKLVGALAFDPLAFTERPDKEQRKILIDLMGVDVAAHDKKIAALRSRRNDLMAQKKRACDEQAEMPQWEGVPEEEASLASLVAQMNKANAANKEYDDLQGLADQQLRELVSLQDELKEIKTRIATAEKAAQESQAKLSQMQHIDTAEIEAQAAALEETNRKVRDNRLYAAKQEDIGRLAEEIHAEYQAIQQAEADKANALASVKLPLDGLSVDADGVTYQGIPLSQVNHAKQLEISMAIQMALNPKLRVMLCNGNGLDDDTFAAIVKMAEERDYQVWLEKAGTDGKFGVVIEDGHIKGELNAEDRIGETGESGG